MRPPHRLAPTIAALAGGWLLAFSAAAQEPAPPAAAASPPAPRVERVDEHTLRVGQVLVDQERGELTLEGTVNRVEVLEYLATSVNGAKSYESALDLQADAVELNLALILLGLDDDRGVPSRFKFDPEPPAGDAVEIWIEWESDGQRRRARAEDAIFNVETGKRLGRGPWVYTGSVFLSDGSYLAALNGVLIGFMHTPESIIDNPLALESGYGSYRLDRELGLAGGTAVTVTIRALREAAAP